MTQEFHEVFPHVVTATDVPRLVKTGDAACVCLSRGYDAMQEFHEVFPHLVTATDVPRLVKTGDVAWDDVDAAFCCLPHATTQVSSPGSQNQDLKIRPSRSVSQKLGSSSVSESEDQGPEIRISNTRSQRQCIAVLSR